MKNQLIFQKADKAGVLYLHQWNTGYQLLLFPDHEYAKTYARKNNWDIKAN